MECTDPNNLAGYLVVGGIISFILFLWWNEDRKIRKEFGTKYQLVLDQLNKTSQ